MARQNKITIKSLIAAVLIVQFVALAIIVGFTLVQLDARRHDYIILNMSGKLRVISEVLLKQSENYDANAPRDYDTYNRDLRFYHRDLKDLIAQYDSIITDFVNRQLSDVSYTTGKEDIICTWDKSSRSQLQTTAATWEQFRQQVIRELGEDSTAPRLEAAAEYIIQDGKKLIWSSNALADSFRQMMEGKLMEIRLLNQAGLVVSSFIAITIFWLLISKVFRSLNITVNGVNRIAQGKLDHKVAGSDFGELQQLSSDFNNLSQRLSSLFRLTQRINKATNLDDTLRFVYEEFKDFHPIDWVGVLIPTPNLEKINLHRVYS
ncbi:MAG: hypothetical protein HUJ30_01005, partial [Gammaproteobacteria bacterium]|nr:hypothetical protein [Gammaproteobacteria bacterium]